MKNLLITYLLLLSFSCLFAQTNSWQEVYPEDDLVTVSLNKRIEIKQKRGKLSIKEIVSQKNYFLTNNRLSLANESINYNSFNTIESISAKTENPLMGKKKYTLVKDYRDNDVLVNGIFFNDQKKKTFTFPNVKEGVYTHLTYTKNINDPHFIPAFIISKNTPIHEAELSVSFPNTVKVAYKTFNTDSLNIDFSESVEGNNIIYKWTLKSLPKINRHYDFSPLYYIPQIIIYIKSFTSNNDEVEILSKPKNLYNWYQSLISNINTGNQEELKKITLNLIEGASSMEEKVKRIYYFVQDQINYVAFEDGLNGFIPRDADDVFDKKYGDCKDMANLLNEMLNYADVPSYLTWIGTRKKPYSYFDVPTPFADNHMITAIKLQNEYLFLDATAKYLPFGYPSPFIQGKEALVGLNNSEFEIIIVPEVDAKRNKININSIFTIDGKILIGEHASSLKGYEKLNMLHKIERKSDEDLDFLFNAMKFGTKKTSYLNLEIDNMDLQNESLDINFKTHTTGQIKFIDNSVYIKPHLDFNLKSELVKNESKNFDKKIDYKSTRSYRSTLKVPEGFSIEALPKESKFEDKDFNFLLSYKLSGNKKEIHITKTISLNTLKVDVKSINKWNRFIKNLNKANKQSIILRKY